jgi:hypothetical protein
LVVLLWHSLILRRSLSQNDDDDDDGALFFKSDDGASIDNGVLQRSSSFLRRSPRPRYQFLDLRTMVLWTCGRFSATAGGGGRVRFAAFAPTKTARKRGRDRGRLAAIVLCFDFGCVALAHSNSSLFSLAERRRR